MRSLVVLGAGTAGTMVVNKLRPRLSRDEWRITVVDEDDWHLYQPGLLLLPFGAERPEDLLQHRSAFVPDGVDRVEAVIDRVDTAAELVHLADGRTLPYDQLVIATGAQTRPDLTPGLLGDHWHRSAFDFYTLEGAIALRDRLADWHGGRLVVQLVGMPITCPVAPLEFAFLADAFFEERGVRADVDIAYVTPLEGAFTKPVASARLGGMLEQRGIRLVPGFVVDHVDGPARRLVSVDDREVRYDLLVTVPLHRGAECVTSSGLGDELGFVPVDRHTFLATGHDNVFVLGDASDIPASKAGTVAHFSVEVFTENFLQHVAGRPMTHAFDGHASCFVESGHGKGLLIDFNYETEPLPGRYPIPLLGPFTLLEESHANHWGKLGFRWAYWHLLLKGRPLPVPTQMSMTGKKQTSA